MTIPQDTCGYTLVELLLVCVLLGVLTGVAVPRMNGFARAAGFRQAGKLLRNDLDRCAREARSRGVVTRMSVTAGEQEYTCDGERRELPHGVTVESFTRIAGGPDPEDGVIRFLPDGRCDAVRIVITDGRRRSEIVNPTLGGFAVQKELPQEGTNG